MKVGFKTEVITPRIGMERPGAVSTLIVQGIHDDCLVSACVLDDGDRSIAICGVDALSIMHSVCEQARDIVTEKTGIHPDSVLFGASHTHAGGPSARGWECKPDPKYVQFLTRQMASAVIGAYRSRTDLHVGFGVGRCEGIAHPRVWMMEDGSLQSHPGRTSREAMLRPLNDTDPQVCVIGFADDHGNPRGCIVNFACHGTTGLGNTRLASSDWIHYLRHALSNTFDPEFFVIFLNGACGDITQVDNTLDPSILQSGPPFTRRVGVSVAGETMRTLVQMSYVQSVRLAAKRKSITLPIRQVTPEMLRWAHLHTESEAQVQGCWFPDHVWAKEWIELDRANKAEPMVEAELQAFSIGSAAIVSNPAECFSILGSQIKQRSKFYPTLVSSLSNGTIGYVGPREAYVDRHIGDDDERCPSCYETTPARTSRLAPGSGEVLVYECVALVNSLKRPEEDMVDTP